MRSDPVSTPLVLVGAVAAALVGLALNGLLRRAAVVAEKVEERAYCR